MVGHLNHTSNDSNMDLNFIPRAVTLRESATEFSQESSREKDSWISNNMFTQGI